LAPEAFEDVLGELEANYQMPFKTEAAIAAIAEAKSHESKIDYVKFLSQEVTTPREEDKL
jgi:hypothetical protein